MEPLPKLREWFKINSWWHYPEVTQRLDKITGYMQLATTLLQTLLPIPSAVATAKPVKENK